MLHLTSLRILNKQMSYFTFDHKISVAPLGWGGIEIHILSFCFHLMFWKYKKSVLALGGGGVCWE